MMNDVRMRIRQAFFIDQLQLGEDNPQMTATEVMQRTEEKLRLMSPVMGRQHHEFLEPLVERSFRMSFEAGQFEEMPAKLADALGDRRAKLQVKYVSQIAKAQRTGEADAFTRFYGVIAPVLEGQPESAQVLNGEELIRRLAPILGVHNSVVRDRKEMKAMREAEAQQAEQQQALDQGEQAANIQQKVGPEQAQG